MLLTGFKSGFTECRANRFSAAPLAMIARVQISRQLRPRRVQACERASSKSQRFLAHQSPPRSVSRPRAASDGNPH